MAKKILIIEDDPTVVKYLSTLFQDNGYETCSAADGVEGFEVLKKEPPDLITLDLDMSKETGPRFFRRMSQSKEFSHLPVIVISGLSRPELAMRKVVAVLGKPFDPNELLNLVRHTIG
ncbi:MAG: DVU0259 family response regulator domain-containing protein [Thermodesulfobacteriota bacterium]